MRRSIKYDKGLLTSIPLEVLEKAISVAKTSFVDNTQSRVESEVKLGSVFKPKIYKITTKNYSVLGKCHVISSFVLDKKYVVSVEIKTGKSPSVSIVERTK